MKNMMLVMMLVLAPVLGFAEEGHEHEGTHTPNLCLNDSPKVCAHFMFPKAVNTMDESQFMLHVLKDKAMTVTNMKVELWMDMGSGHGHGSAPVKIQQKSPEHFFVTNAFFMMEGEWIVRVDFELDGVARHLEFPIVVQ